MTAHEQVRAAVLDHASSLGADTAARMAHGELSPEEALRVLVRLRARHLKAPSWEVCLVRDHAHTSMAEFLAEVGHTTFARWFVSTFAPRRVDLAEMILDEVDALGFTRYDAHGNLVEGEGEPEK